MHQCFSPPLQSRPAALPKEPQSPYTPTSQQLSCRGRQKETLVYSGILNDGSLVVYWSGNSAIHVTREEPVMVLSNTFQPVN